MEEIVKRDNTAMWRDKLATWLNQPQDSQKIERFIVAMKTLMSDNTFATATNAKQVLETIARLGILPIPEHMTWTVIQGKIVLYPSARGLTFAIINSGLVKDIECEVVYAPDKIMFPTDVYSMPDTDPAKPYLLKQVEHLEPGTPVVVKKAGDLGGLVGSVCRMITNEGEVKYHVMRAKELQNIKEGFSKCPTSTAWTKTESEMYKKIHVKRAIKFEMEKSGRLVQTEAERFIDFDNEQNYEVKKTRSQRFQEVRERWAKKTETDYVDAQSIDATPPLIDEPQPEQAKIPEETPVENTPSEIDNGVDERDELMNRVASMGKKEEFNIPFDDEPAKN